jgi:hypothetical protein
VAAEWRPTGAEFHLWSFRDGVVVRFEWFYRRERAMRTAVLG